MSAVRGEHVILHSSVPVLPEASSQLHHISLQELPSHLCYNRAAGCTIEGGAHERCHATPLAD
jgi:hypothetical protein